MTTDRDLTRAPCYLPGMFRMSLFAAVVMFAGCEKAGPKASGKLTDSETALLAHLPKDAALAFGGNLPRLQHQIAKSPLMKMQRQQMAEMMPDGGVNEWQDCLAGKPLKELIGTVDVQKGFDMHYAMSGLQMSDLEDCAKASKMPYQVDSDRKFITLTMHTKVLDAKMAYLILKDGTAYSHQTLSLGAGFTPSVKDPSRAEFEAEVAATEKENLAGNSKLAATLEKVDRTKGIWFGGDASDAPMIGDKAGELYGFMDLEDGLEIDATALFKDKATITQIIKGLEQAKDAGDILGSDFKAALKAVELKQDGDHLRLIVKLSNKQIERLVDTLQKFGGMGMGMGGRRSKAADFDF